MHLPLRICGLTLAALMMWPTLGSTGFAAELDDRAWEEVKTDAHNFVKAESPAGVWPFAKRHIAAGSSPRRVIAHYFPPFPISIDNRSAGEDYYARNYLRPEGENGKFSAKGGYLRQRPLPTKVWPKHRARETNFAIDVLRAEAIGIDAFGIDLIHIGKGAHWTTAVTLLEAAHRVSTTFRVVPEPDMNGLKNATLEELEEALAVFFAHPAGFRLADGRLLVAPFLAEARPPAFWMSLIARMEKRGAPIALMPILLNATRMHEYAPFSIGVSFWGDRDADAGHTLREFATKAKGIPPIQVMLPIAPQDFRAKDGVMWEARNSESFRGQWQAAIASGAEYVQLVTWNDYSEATEIAPSSATQFFFYDLCAYYIAWFKGGEAPPITQDALYFSHRRQILDPRAGPRGAAFKVAGSTPLANEVEVLALTTAPATLEIEVGRRATRAPAPAGLAVHRVAAAPGKVVFRLIRNGKVVLQKVSDWPIDETPIRHDALYAGGTTTRAFVPVADFQD